MKSSIAFVWMAGTFFFAIYHISSLFFFVSFLFFENAIQIWNNL